MIPIDINSEHYKAFLEWRKKVSEAYDDIASQDIKGAIAALWQMRYECLVAQLKVEMRGR